MSGSPSQKQHNFPDEHSASEEYARRFSGAIGAWMLSIQSSILLKLVPSKGKTLDVGGGHGQVAPLLLAEGHDVTVLGSSELAFYQLNQNGEKIQRKLGPLLPIDAEDKEFSLVTSFRIVCHMERWQEFIGELCRVSSDAVIMDYPSKMSVNAISDLLFGFKKGIEKNTRDFLVFRDEEITNEFAKHGFAVERRERQFFFPMVLHRAMKNTKLSSTIEKIARVAALTGILGSPVILLARRTKG